MNKIIFICKHNVFRSKTAEAIFKKKYKGKKYNVLSRGIFPFEGNSNHPVIVKQQTILNKFEYKFKTNPQPLTYKEINDHNILIIVANDIPKSLFERYKKNIGKLIVWKIKDADKNNDKEITSAINQIEKKVIKFVEDLK